MNFMSDEYIRARLKECYNEATMSPDPSTQVGSIIVSRLKPPWYATLSHNGWAEGWKPSPEDFERPRKYQLLEHSERNSIYAAARRGLPLEHCTMVATWAACSECSKAIVQCGISKLVRHAPEIVVELQGRWQDDIALGDEILKAGNVEVVEIKGPIPGAAPILMGGQLYDPSL